MGSELQHLHVLLEELPLTKLEALHTKHCRVSASGPSTRRAYVDALKAALPTDDCLQLAVCNAHRPLDRRLTMRAYRCVVLFRLWARPCWLRVYFRVCCSVHLVPFAAVVVQTRHRAHGGIGGVRRVRGVFMLCQTCSRRPMTMTRWFKCARVVT